MTHEKDERINVGAGMVPTYHATESVEEARAVVESCWPATYELRRMLDERGVKWTDHGHKNHVWWKGFDGVRWHAENRHCVDGWRVKVEAVLTPEQAIYATLGPGECHADETDTMECVCDGIGHYGERIAVHVMECSACGRTYEHVWGSYEYCPHCGRLIKKEDE